MSLRFQRLLLILISLTMIMFAILLILYNSRENISFFFTPTELLNSKIVTNKQIRIGGFVEKNSFIKISASSFVFNLTDNVNSIKITYNGILPDLFKEEQGAVVEGKLNSKKLFIAKNVFAKHDENYMPSLIKKDLENMGYWKKNYK